MTETFLGTLAYLSPERLMSNQYSYAADVWALGLTVMFLLTGSLGMDTTDYWKMVANINSMPSLDAAVYGGDCVHFVNQCLIVEPDERPTAEQLLRHPWMAMRVETAGDEIWKADLEDLDVILSLIIDRHLMPNLITSNMDIPHLITQQSVPVPAHITLHSAAADRAAGSPHTIAEETHELLNHSQHHSSSPSLTGMSDLSTPHVIATSTTTSSTNNSTTTTTFTAPNTTARSAQSSSIPSADSAVGGGVTRLTVELTALHIDVPGHRSSLSLPSSHSSATSSPSSPSEGGGGEDVSPLSPSSASASSPPPPESFAELDYDRAALLAEQFGISQQAVQERLQALWEVKIKMHPQPGGGTGSSAGTGGSPASTGS